LAEAREKCQLLRRLAKSGLDPIVERDKDRRSIPTFKEAAAECHGALKNSWSEKNAISFLSSLKEHAFPLLGAMRVDSVDASHMASTLAPIWTSKPEMARKVRQRIGIVLNFSKSRGWRTSEAPGRSVTICLGKRPKGGNFAAMPYDQVPLFVADLYNKPETTGRLALLFAILTAARSGEVRAARLDQIDWIKMLWRRPAEIMKGGLEHSVTLSEPALALLHRIIERQNPKPADLLFPSSRGLPLSDMTISKVMRDAAQSYTVHGFRSSFRDWAAEQMSTIPDAAAEACLAHVIPDRVVRAYLRSDFLKMRRELMEGWGDFVSKNGSS
jgi:integrase